MNVEAAAMMDGKALGRVVLQHAGGTPNRLALEAALLVARAFESELESLFVEDRRLLDLAGFPFASEISLCGRRSTRISPNSMLRQMHHMAAAFHREVGRLAQAADIPLHARVVRDEPVQAMAKSCAECGETSLVALAEPVRASTAADIKRVFDDAAGVQGVVLVGPRARSTDGPVVAALEDVSHLSQITRAAERLLTVSSGGSLVLALAGRSEAETAEMEGQVRLALAADEAVSIIRVNARHGHLLEVVKLLQATRPGFIVAHFGGFIAPATAELRHLLLAIQCPLLLLR